jgi:hypothetical protein
MKLKTYVAFKLLKLDGRIGQHWITSTRWWLWQCGRAQEAICEDDSLNWHYE